MSGECKLKKTVLDSYHPDKRIRDELIDGYKEMSRINLSLAEDAVVSDNDALHLVEQKFAERE